MARAHAHTRRQAHTSCAARMTRSLRSLATSVSACEKTKREDMQDRVSQDTVCQIQMPQCVGDREIYVLL